MHDEYACLASLPGTQREQSWLRERLETLSVWEGTALAALVHQPPDTAEDAVNCFLSLQGCSVYLDAGNYEKLGERVLRSLAGSDPEELLPHMDLDALGTWFEEQHPGVFVGDCYIAYPTGETPVYHGRDSPLPQDTEWSVKLKLASPAVPNGVWLRLPDYQGFEPEDISDGEIVLAKNTLQVQSLCECTLLEARCVLPEVGNLQEQYDSIDNLVFDGNNLGFILDERGQGAPHWMEKFAAALEYENCHTLRFALDISQNLNCYEWISREGLKEFAAKHLRSCGVSEELTRSGALRLEDYAEDLLETSGYLLTGGENGYITRNSRTFSCNYSMETEIPAEAERLSAQKESTLPENILNAFPHLCGLTSNVRPEEAASANAAIRDALASRGLEGLRQLQTAMEFEECDCLEDAVAIAAHLDCYDFIDIQSFCEATKAELLSKGVDKKALCCFDYETYAALTHDFGFIHTSDNAGMYLCKTDPSFQLPKWQEQSGMAGPSM